MFPLFSRSLSFSDSYWTKVQYTAFPRFATVTFNSMSGLGRGALGVLKLERPKLSRENAIRLLQQSKRSNKTSE